MRISDWSSDVCSSDLPSRSRMYDAGFRRPANAGPWPPERNPSMPDQLRYITTLVAAVVVAVGVAAAGKFAGDGFRLGRAADRYVTVKGLAERTVTADLAVWPIRVTATGNDLGVVQSKVDQSLDALSVFLVGEGIAQEAPEGRRVEVKDRKSTRLNSSH